MTLHKLTAGDGYTYLTRQVAVMDSTERGHSGLGDYYSERGESPGRWVGSGLSGLAGVNPGQDVTEVQMQALFDGLHPGAAAIEASMREAGATSGEIDAATRLGRRFRRPQDTRTSFRSRCAAAFADHNTDAGLPRDWPVPADVRAQIRTDVGTTMFRKAYQRMPSDARELSGFLARASRPPVSAVAGYDLTFSPVKSVSALWALAPREVSEQIQSAHAGAVADTVDWLEREVAYTRVGTDGIRQVDVTGLIAACFTHRDSRAGDADLHTHVAVSNKVQSVEGKWLALDGRVLHKAVVAASERYNTRVEAHLRDTLGLRFAERPSSDVRKRSVREIVGIEARLLSRWSARRAAIDSRRAELATDFQAAHGRAPTPIEAIHLAQRATLETRNHKHEPRSVGQQRAAWRREALETVGGPPGLTRMLARTLNPSPAEDANVLPPLADLARHILTVVAAQRATWQVWHIRAEAERQVRAHPAIAPAEVDQAVDRLVEAALSPGQSVRLAHPEPVTEPTELRRHDGASVYSVAGTQLYTSQEVLEAEDFLVQAASRRNARRIPALTVETALLESAANGVDLNPGQAQLVHELATSGASVQLAIAPAGSGKTTAMSVLSRAWADAGGTVIGLAPSAVAAAGLRAQIGGHADTLAKLVLHHRSGIGMPDALQRIGADSLVIIDEAGMAGTVELADAVRYVLDRGGAVRLIGDDQQLASISAGGALRDIAERHGTVTLSELIRFSDRAEGAATLGIRAGDPAALGYYLDLGRVHVGDLSTVADQAFTAWSADRAAGRDAVMLAPTRDLVAQLNARARADRLTADGGAAGREVALADSNRASSGDQIITRRNDRLLRLGATDWVKNGDRWTITAVRKSGAAQVIHDDSGRRMQLPAAYVAQHVDLGYASTVHGAQGITADTCHAVAAGGEDRQLLYVALTRGRHANHVYLATSFDGDPHAVITPNALRPPTATDLLTAILARDAAQRSASTLQRELAEPHRLLHRAATRYADALTAAAESVLGPDWSPRIEDVAERALPGLTDAPAWPSLRGRLALLAVDGADPMEYLRVAAQARELDSAADPAAVLDWRLDPAGRDRRDGPLPWLPPVPTALAGHPGWGPYLQARTDLVTSTIAAVRDSATVMTPLTAPVWAEELLRSGHSDLRADVAVWRAATGVEPTDRRPTGPARLAAAERRPQQQLDTQIKEVLTMGGLCRAAHWSTLAESIDPRITRDTHWPALAQRLDSADRAGVDIGSLLTTEGTSKPLPDELPAAALWWRLSRHLAPAAMTATAASGASALRPEWVSQLANHLRDDQLTRVLNDPAWPALVAAMNSGIRYGWVPEDLLDAAAHAMPARLANAELATALVFRLALLTDPVPVDSDTVAEPLPDPLAEASAAAEDAHLLDDLDDPHPSAALPTTFRAGPDAEPPDALDEDAGIQASPTFDPDDQDQWLSWLGLQTDEAAYEAAEAERHKWAIAPVSRERLHELNSLAHNYFRTAYPTSWAAGDLRKRLGTDLLDHPNWQPGYAPAGWTHLTDHLHSQGATDDELLAAELSSTTRTGRLIDRFRDRLIFPIRDSTGNIVAFIGRRHPNHDNTGPKYLNTGNNDLYTKGAHLFGLHECLEALTAGAVPVLVEGQVDALAVSLAGDDAVGVALLGTAFTDRQTDLLSPYLYGQRGVIVATDPDAAGEHAALRAYWQLTGRRAAPPRRLDLPAETDPASLYQQRPGGPALLRAALEDAPDLAGRLIATVIADARDTVRDRDHAVQSAAQIIAALPPDAWPNHVDKLTAALDLPVGIAHMAVLDVGQAWILDPAAEAAAQLRTPRQHQDRNLPQPAAATRSQQSGDPWRALATGISPRLPAGRDWALLVEAIQRAFDGGYDVTAQLPVLAAAQPLPAKLPARELYWRLLEACPSAAPGTRGVRARTSARPANGRNRTTTEPPNARRATGTPGPHP